MTTPVDNKQIEKRGTPEEVKQDSLLLKMLPAPVVLQILTHAITSPKDILTLKGVCRLWDEILWFSFMPIMSKVFGLPRRNPFPQPSTNTKMALAENLHNHAKDIAEIMSSNRPEDIGPFINYDLSKSTRSEKLHYLKQAILKNKEDLVKFFADGLNLSHSEKFEYLKEAVLVNNKAIIQFFSDSLSPLSDAEKNELILAAIQSGNMDIISDANLSTLSREDKVKYLIYALQSGHEDIIDLFIKTIPDPLTRHPEYLELGQIYLFIEKLPDPLTRHEYLQLAQAAVRYNCVRLLIKTIDIESISNFTLLSLSLSAIRHGHEEVINFFLSKPAHQSFVVQEKVWVRTAAEHGRINAINHVDFKNYERSELIELLVTAVRSGHQETINFFLEKCPNLSENENRKILKMLLKDDDGNPSKIASINYVLNEMISSPAAQLCFDMLSQKKLFNSNPSSLYPLFIKKILEDEKYMMSADQASMLLKLTAAYGLLKEMQVILEKRSGSLFSKDARAQLLQELLELSTVNGQVEVMDYILLEDNLSFKAKLDHIDQLLLYAIKKLAKIDDDDPDLFDDGIRFLTRPMVSKGITALLNTRFQLLQENNQALTPYNEKVKDWIDDNIHSVFSSNRKTAEFVQRAGTAILKNYFGEKYMMSVDQASMLLKLTAAYGLLKEMQVILEKQSGALFIKEPRAQLLQQLLELATVNGQVEVMDNILLDKLSPETKLDHIDQALLYSIQKLAKIGDNDLFNFFGGPDLFRIIDGDIRFLTRPMVSKGIKALLSTRFRVLQENNQASTPYNETVKRWISNNFCSFYSSARKTAEFVQRAGAAIQKNYEDGKLSEKQSQHS